VGYPPLFCITKYKFTESKLNLAKVQGIKNKHFNMQQITLATLVKTGVVTGVSKLRANTNSYPYVTLLSGNKSQNVYFGKKSAEILGKNSAIGDNILPLLRNAEIVESTNAEGEIRYKMSISGSTNYSDKADLLATFGAEEIVDFNIATFQAQFQAKATTTATA
jgi:hypothetical protein